MKKVVLILFIALISFSNAQDKKGCEKIEPNYLTRMPGYFISECKFSEHNEKEFIYYVNGKAIKIKKAGAYREIWYRKDAKETRKYSSMQIFQNFSNAIEKINGKVLADNKTFMTASIDGKEVYIQLPSITSADVGSFNVNIIEVAQMKQDIQANLQEAIDRDGKIALYGILFDVGKSNIKPESTESLNNIINYLNSNPSVNIFVVGHTDNTGNYNDNITLSKARAESIKNYLISNGKIAENRIIAEGVGSLCPKTTNSSEDGRKLNRRVEIVKQ
jgi:outer membrane protein OmpA-like peptidoglycan-associated protein